MSNVIDTRVTELGFDNKQFESGVKTSLTSIDKLKQGLNFDESSKSLEKLAQAGKSFSLAGIGEGVQTIASKFTALGAVGFTIMQNLTNAAIDMGKKLANAIIEPAKKGFAEYETQMNAVQTIMANTAAKGTTLEQVNAALDQLNTYADKTIYNFSEMARNIGTFTAAGLDLDTSVSAIKGIANLAAVSGSTSQQASVAMYQLSQALSSGTVKLQDWNSVVNAGMGGQVFQDALKETARLHKISIDDMIKQEGSFRNTLQKGWLTSEILSETLAKFTGDLNADQLKTMGYTEEQIAAILKLGQVANDAATKVKTFSQLKETLQEAIQSGWAKSWLIILGDFEEAKAFFTEVSDRLGVLVGESSDARNELLQGWKDLGGRSYVIMALRNAFEGLLAITKPIKEAFTMFFPPKTAVELTMFTMTLVRLTEKLKISEGTAAQIKRTFGGVFAILSLGIYVISELVKGFLRLAGGIKPSGDSILNFTANLGDWLQYVRSAIIRADIFKKGFDKIPIFLGAASKAFKNFLAVAGPAIEKIRTFLTGLFEKVNLGSISAMVEKVKKFFYELWYSTSNFDTSGVDSFFDKIGGRFEPLRTLVKILGTILGAVGKVVAKISPMFFKVASGIGKFLAGVAAAIAEGVAGLDFSKIFDIINSGLLVALLLAIKNFVTKGSGTLDSLTGNISGIFSGITGILDGVRGSLETWQKSLQAKTLLTIAMAIGILTISLIALSMIDSKKLTTALLAVTAMFADLMGSMAIYSKVAGAGGGAGAAATLIALSVALLIMAGAITAMSKIDPKDMQKGLSGIINLTLVLLAFSKLLSKNSGDILKASAGLILFSIALNILILAVKQLGKIDPVELANGLIGVGVLLAEIAAFLNLTKFDSMGVSKGVGIMALAGAIVILTMAVAKFGEMDAGKLQQGLIAVGIVLAEMGLFIKMAGDGKNLIATGVGMTILAASMLIFAEAIGQMGKLSWEEIGKGLLVMAGALTIIFAAVKLFPKNTIVTAIALTIIASALLILSKALKDMGSMSWEEIARGLATLAGAMAILAIGMYAMQGALPGAAALLIISAALAIFVPILTTLGTMSLGEIGLGLLALAGIFTILALAGYLLTPVVPTLLSLGVAMMLIGAATALVGVGILAFSAGLTALAISGAAGATAIVAIVGILLGLIPLLVTSIVEAIILFAQLIGEAAPVICEALTKTLLALIGVIVAVAPPLFDALKMLLLGLIDLIITVVPTFIDALLYLIGRLLSSLAAKMPEFVQSGIDIILAFLKGIRDNIFEIVTVAIDIVTNFIDAVALKLPDIIDSGWNLIISFINGLADSIDKNAPALNEAVGKLGTAIVTGLSNGIAGAGQNVIDAIGKLAGAAIDALKTLLGIFSPSRVSRKFGGLFGEGFVMGLEDMGSSITKATTNMGKDAISGMSDAIAIINDSINGNMDLAPTIRPVVDLSEVIAGGKQADKVFTNQLNMAGTTNRISGILETMPYNTIPPTNQADKGNVITFTQYNTSPLPLSRLEIYRQTRNQLMRLNGLVKTTTG